jgi:hypothetical protein
VPKVRSQKRQLCAEIDVLFTPQQKPENGKRMSQVMETNVPVADIGLCESQKLSGPQAGKIQKAQGSA